MFLTSCPSDFNFDTTCNVDIPLEDLVWLKEIKNSFEQSSSASKKQIVQYNFNNETVFLIDGCVNCADNLTTLYNCEGEVICEFGGIAGLNTCPNFENEAIDRNILWEN
jgi:hypothetical protein